VKNLGIAWPRNIGASRNLPMGPVGCVPPLQLWRSWGIWSPPTLATDGCTSFFWTLWEAYSASQTSLLNLKGKERRVRKGMGETWVEQQRGTKGRMRKRRGSASTPREQVPTPLSSNFSAEVARMPRDAHSPAYMPCFGWSDVLNEVK